MATTYAWKIISEDVFPEYEGYLKYIYRLTWEYTGTNGIYTATVSGSTDFVTPIEPYIPFDQVTSDDMVAWLNEYAGVSVLQDEINIEILHQQYNVIYKWNIMSMTLYPNYDGFNDYVTAITWKYDANIEDVEGVYLFGNTNYSSVPTDFTPYNELTELQVAGWLESSPMTPTYKKNLDKQLIEKLSPPVISLALPWN
jgi:hypothetical protein